MVPLKFRMPLDIPGYPVLVNIYAEDGTVAVSHGGVEIGQGINTKVAQVAAMTLNVPMESIVIKPCSTITAPNTGLTGGSSTSEMNCLVCCCWRCMLYLMSCVYKIEHYQGLSDAE